MVKSPFNCVIYPLTQPQVANQQKKVLHSKKCLHVPKLFYSQISLIITFSGRLFQSQKWFDDVYRDILKTILNIKYLCWWKKPWTQLMVGMLRLSVKDIFYFSGKRSSLEGTTKKGCKFFQEKFLTILFHTNGWG